MYLGRQQVVGNTIPILCWPLLLHNLQKLPRNDHHLMMMMRRIQIMIMRMIESAAGKTLIWKSIKRVLGKLLESSCLPSHSRRSLLSQELSRNLTSSAQVQWHSVKYGNIRRALNYCAKNCVWPDWSEKLYKTSRWTFVSRQQPCWPFRKPWKHG